MKLVIEIPLDGNDLEAADFERFVKESKLAGGIDLEVGRSISEKTPEVTRRFSIGAEYFTVKVVESA